MDLDRQHFNTINISDSSSSCSSVAWILDSVKDDLFSCLKVMCREVLCIRERDIEAANIASPRKDEVFHECL